MNHTITLVAAKVALGATLALGFLAAPPGPAAHADTLGHYDAYAAEVGDDNGDGIVMEDESGLVLCRLRQPCLRARQRAAVAPAGKYDVGGVLMDPWPVDPSAWEGDEYVGGYN